MKLHEMKQKRNTIATDMRALHDKIGDTTWTEEQRTQWNAAKSELDALDERIAREEELRRHDQSFVDEQEPEQRQRQDAHRLLRVVRAVAEGHEGGREELQDAEYPRAGRGADTKRQP